jgi:hypothetical protein
MKKLILAGLVVVGALTAVSTTTAQNIPQACWGVRCAACPEGTHWAPKANDCCRCVPD